MTFFCWELVFAICRKSRSTGITTLLFFTLTTDSIEIQVKQHADIKDIYKRYSITITFCCNMADCFGNGSAITTVPLDALYPGYQRFFRRGSFRLKGLCLNSARQKDSGGALVTSFRVGRFSAIPIWRLFL